MTIEQLEKRVKALEKAVEQLKAQATPAKTSATRSHWWHDQAGRFANDPIFDEIVRLGREYRESLRPGKKGKSNKKNARARHGSADRRPTSRGS